MKWLPLMVLIAIFLSSDAGAKRPSRKKSVAATAPKPAAPTNRLASLGGTTRLSPQGKGKMARLLRDNIERQKAFSQKMADIERILQGHETAISDWKGILERLDHLSASLTEYRTQAVRTIKSRETTTGRVPAEHRAQLSDWLNDAKGKLAASDELARFTTASKNRAEIDRKNWETRSRINGEWSAQYRNLLSVLRNEETSARRLLGSPP